MKSRILVLLLCGLTGSCSQLPGRASQEPIPATFSPPVTVVAGELYPPLQALLDRLMAGAPAGVPVAVRFEYRPRYLGLTTRDLTTGRAVVGLNPAYSFETLAGVLIHEWAHVLSPGTGHDEEWGRAYSRAYRAARGL